MKKHSTIILISVFIVLSGCVSFSPTAITKQLPNDIKDRNNLVTTAIWKYELAELTGSILVEYKTPVEGKNYGLTTRTVKSTAEPKVIQVKDGKLLTFMVDKSSSTKLKVIGFGGGSIDTENKMEVTYTDVSRTFIKQSNWDLVKLKEEALKELKPNEKAKYFIQAALLSVIHRKEYSKAGGALKANVNGSGIKADSKIYSSNKVATKDYMIHLTLRNISDFKDDKSHEFTNPAIIEGLWIDRNLKE